MPPKVMLAGAFVLIAVLTVLLLRTTSDRARLSAEWLNARSAVDHLQTQIDEMSKNRLSADQLARLQGDQREAIRLRGEVTRLRKALDEAGDAATKAPAVVRSADPLPTSSLKTEPLPEGNPEVRVHKTSLISAQLPAGSSLLIGGWESRPGKRTFAIVEPKREAWSDAIRVGTRWIELPDETAQRLRIGSLLDTSGEQSATLGQTSSADFVKVFEEEPGVDILSSPIVTTLSGRQARVSVTDTRSTLAGPVDFGQQLDILPIVTENGAIGVTLQASITLPRGPGQAGSHSPSADP